VSLNPRRIEDIRKFWESHPVAASAIPHPLGTPEYFQCYDRLREANESVAFSYRLHEYREFSSRRVLDIGCGNGYVLSKYALEGAQVYGVDITQTALDLCSRRFVLLGSDGSLCQGNAEELPFKEAMFDCVCSMGVLHHTPSPARAVEEIFRVLKPQGRFIVMMYHRNSALFRFTFSVRSALTGKPTSELVDEVDGPGNPKGDVYSKGELRRLLNRFGDLQLFVGLLQREMLWSKVGSVLPDWLLRMGEPHVGWFLYAKCIKP